MLPADGVINARSFLASRNAYQIDASQGSSRHTSDLEEDNEPEPLATGVFQGP